MKSKSLFLFLSVGVLLTACHPSSEKAAAKAQQVVRTETQGTGDSAGGNSYRGRALESYILTDLNQLPSYSSLLKPWLDKISPIDTFLGHDLKTILEKKTIYLIPGPISELPPERIGSAVPTEQVALQDFQQIWINSEIFNKMTAEEQMKLLVHEMLVGLRIFQFDSPYHQCLMQGQKMDVCMSFSHQPSGSPQSLTESDYLDIRTTTQDLTQNGVEWTYRQLDELMFSRGFRGISLSYGSEESVESISFEELFNRFEYRRVTSGLPTNGYDIDHFLLQNPDYEVRQSHLKTWPWSPHEKCSFQYSKNNSDLKVQVVTGTQNLSFQYNLKDKIDLYRFQEKSTVTRRASLTSDSAANQNFGEKRIFSELIFDGGDLSIHMQEMVCVERKGSECIAWNTFEGAMDYECSTEKSKTR